MLDRSHIGAVISRHTTVVEPGRLRLFAKATAQSDPRYSDLAAARASGYEQLPVPPTFLFCLDMMDSPNPRATLELLGIDVRKILHAEQGFTYHRMVFAGEQLTFETRITDIYDKKGGALEFVVRQIDVTDAGGALAAELRSTLVVRH
ncbi:MAG: MaoC family dehydratase N-terminal domain-containing protein [Comamonas sp.]